MCKDTQMQSEIYITFHQNLFSDCVFANLFQTIHSLTKRPLKNLKEIGFSFLYLTTILFKLQKYMNPFQEKHANVSVKAQDETDVLSNFRSC